MVRFGGLFFACSSRPNLVFAAMNRVLIVCMGNVCRSPMAAAIATKLAIEAGLGKQVQFESAGTHAGSIGQLLDSRVATVLERKGYEIRKRRSRKVVEKDFARFDVILAMDRANLADLRRTCPAEHQHKVRLFLTDAGLDEIPDPYYGNLHGFERVLDLCEIGVRAFLTRNLGDFPGLVTPRPG